MFQKEIDMDPDEIDGRLANLEGSIAVTSRPPGLTAASRRRRTPALAFVAAPVLVLAFAATAIAGAVIGGQLAKGAPGVENSDQPLAGARLECMSPPQAGAYLAAHGYTDVVWQVEGDGAGKTGSSWQQSTPPEHGFVIPGAVLDDGKLYMIVDQHSNATGVGACHGMAMP